MRVTQLTAFIVRLPLKREITHASATRRESTNLWIRCRLTDGTQGWGEGVPRSYVTDETPEGGLDQLARTPLADQLQAACGSWPDVLRLCAAFRPVVEGNDPRGCRSNALRCAVELALLDAFGQCLGEPVSSVTRHVAEAASVYAVRDSVRYSTTITAESPRRERISALKMRIYGFAQCKVKVGMPGRDDRDRLARIRRWLGRNVDVRLDANEAWSPEELLSKVEPLVPFGITSLEQPVAHERIAELAPLRQQLPVPIMLDESLTSMRDAEAAVRDATCDLFNIRLSKCGGFLESLRLAAYANQHGLGYQLGCHPGESGILSSAGRHFATTVAGIRYLEGSYDRHLLRELPTQEDVTFGYGGRAPALTSAGLGIHINPDVLRRITVRQQSFDLA